MTKGIHFWGGRRRAAEATASLQAAEAALWGAWEQPEPQEAAGGQVRQLSSTRVHSTCYPLARPGVRPR